jgi:hypothetical protein
MLYYRPSQRLIFDIDVVADKVAAHVTIKSLCSGKIGFVVSCNHLILVLISKFCIAVICLLFFKITFSLY